MRVVESIEVAASPEVVWAFVGDSTRYLDFMAGITRWEVSSLERDGLGARYRMLLRVGSAEVGGLIEIVEWVPERDLAWTSVTGVDQRGRWRIRAVSDSRTRVELRLSYGVAGAGIFGWAAERIASPMVRSHLQRTLDQLRRLVEHEQQRRRAAERRAGRVVAS